MEDMCSGRGFKVEVVVSGSISEGLMLGVKNFAEDVGAAVVHVDKDASPAVITVSGGIESGLAHLLGSLSEVMRTFGIAEGA